ncbi:MAG: hypothetical protein IKG99_00775 [Bacteroidaceae bacterium]|nr:hypothetical protein [Bacteroidaceae bacterium]
MKKKLLLLLSMLAMTFSYNVMAQTDITSWITDPDFEQEGRSVWKTNSFGRQGNNDFPLKHGGYYREVWSGGTAGDAYIYQDLTGMPAGTYTMTVACQNIKQSDTSYKCTGTWIYANDKRTAFNFADDYSVTCVVKDGNLRIGAEIKDCTGNYVCIDNVRLSYEVIYADIKDYLEQIVAEAEKIDKHDGSAEGEEMEAAKDALKALMDKAQSEGLDEALRRLRDAMWAYRLHRASPSEPMDMTEYITNPSFESGNDGWQFDGMGTQGNNDFRKVGNTYAEKWCDWGQGVANAKLWQTLTDLPNGNYKLTAVAQNIQQNSPSTKQKGCYVCGGDNRTEVNVYGSYEVQFVCYSGEAAIGFQTLNATGNYCCVDDFHLYYLGYDADDIQAALNELISQAEKWTDKDMNTDVKEALLQAIANAKAEGAVTDNTVSKALQDAITAAQTSNALYVQLDAIIAKGESALSSGKPNVRDMLETAINNAKDLKASGKVDSDKIAAAEKAIDNGILAYRVLNGTGTAPKVTTGEVIVGSSAMVARMNATGSNIIERGFCWAENPNPSVLDEHTTYSQTNDETNWSPVYIMYNVKPSTEYWVRAYAMTNTYAVGYGDPVRVITLPKGETEYTFLWNGDDEHNEWLDNAMREATAYYNTWTAIKGFHPTANYSPGTETADCSYGGWINVGPWRCNTGTMVHEMMHGTGVGQHGRYWSQELHPGGDNGPWWLGERANRVCHFFENYDTSRGNYNCNGDGIHICYEGNGNDMQQIRSCILMQALYEDGLPATYDGACPFYSFESIDTLQYYITNCSTGTGTKFLCESVTGKLTYKSVDNLSDLKTDNSFAWNFIYDKMTGLYFIRNVKTGKYFQHSGSAVNLSATQPRIQETIQLMPARIFYDINIGGQVIKKKPYWFARSDRSENPAVVAIEGTSSISTPGLDFSNNATKQFWMIYTDEEIDEIELAQNALHQERLERLIAGSKAVAASNHNQSAEGQDKDFLAVVEGVEQEKADYTASQTEEAVQQLYDNLYSYLPSIEVIDSIDISFIIDDAELNTGSNWEGLPELTDGMLRITNAPVFTATSKLPTRMPAGTYGLLANGYQRPGPVTTAIKDYVDGKNMVRATLTLNNSTLRLKHIAEGGSDTKLDQGGTESRYSDIYVPSNNAAIDAYFKAGRYVNLLKAEFVSPRAITIGIKVPLKTENDLLVVDGFRLFYYGNKSLTGIDDLKSDSLSNEVEGYYDLNGVRLAQPGRGVTIVKYKDGHAEKRLMR